MHKILLTLLVSMASSYAFAQLYSNNIHVVINDLGNARISETRQVEINRGSEGYIKMYDLQGRDIGDLAVTDENGTEFTNITPWKVNASFDEKAYKCGIYEAEEGKGEKDDAYPALGAGPGGHQLPHELFVAESPDAAAAQCAHYSVDNGNERHQQQKPEVFGRSKVQHHGILLISRRTSSSSSRHISAARAYLPKSSLYTGKLSMVVRAFSILLISE